MNKFAMVRMLNEAKEALSDTGLLTGHISPEGGYVVDEGSKNLMGHLILATAIAESSEWGPK